MSENTKITNTQDITDPERLIETDDKFSKSDHVHYKEILHRYYRQSLPFDIQSYKNLDEQPPDARIGMKNDPFFRDVGKYVHILDFSEQERIKFGRENEVQHLIVFLLFERDLDVLEAVFGNPQLPTKVLYDFINLIKERDIDREDDKILKLAQKVMKRRSRRIVKVREIHTANTQPIQRANLITLFSYLIDDDAQVRMAAENVVSALDVQTLINALEDDSLIHTMRESIPKITAISIFRMLESAVHLEIRNLAAGSDLGADQTNEHNAARRQLTQVLQDRKRRELEKCVEDPTDLFNATLITYLHFDKDTDLRTQALEILQPDDIIDLVSDDSTPRHISSQVLPMLEKSTDERVRQRTTEIRLKEAERLNKKMKEIEVSVNAYFDVIFQSLNYSRINSQKEAVTMLRGSLNYLQLFAKEAKNLESGSATVAQGVIRQAIEHFEGSINALYSDTKRELFTEFEEIQGMVRHILDLKSFKFEEESGVEDEVDEAVLNKAVMIWRNTISQFLGRIKDLEEMLRIKWGKLMTENEPKRKQEENESDLYEAFGEIETMHKNEVDCKLKIPCRECKRRGCASERFMLQVDFLLEEIHQGFKHDKQTHHA